MHIEDKEVQAFFDHLELGGADVGRLFRLLDRTGNGKVDAEEFVTGCLCLRGGAKTMDVAAVVLELTIFMEYFAEEIETIKHAVMDNLESRSDSPLEGRQDKDQRGPLICL